MKKIYTLGTDRRSGEDFVEILHAYDVQALFDVRSIPSSRIPLFRKKALEQLLSEEGIAYHYLGTELGGFRKGGYAEYTATDDFRRGIDILESIALTKVSVLICAEKLPWKCHRKWIARELNRRGWEVGHIIDKGKVWVPK
jgi:uncharacterized protein (DUF488 family)